MENIQGKRIAIVATHGFEQSELTEPKRQLAEAGATVHVVSPESGEIRGWDNRNWGESVKVDVALDDAKEGDYDALVLPGGQMNPDILRANDKVLALVRAFYDAKKPIAAICHAPWLLIETGIAKGRRMTSYHSLKTDVINAGAEWQDEAVVTDQGIITSRHPGDLDAFCAKIAEELNEGRHEHRQVA